MTNPSIRLFLARHGRTAWNLERRFQGLADIPLDEVGREQALELANALRGRFEAVIASDLARASESARIIASALDLPLLTLDPALRERSWGVFEGLTADECAARYPNEWMASRGKHNFLPPGGEPFEAVVVRIERALLRHVEQLRGHYQSVLVMGHGSSTRMFIEHLTGEAQASMANLEYREVVHDGERFALARALSAPLQI